MKLIATAIMLIAAIVGISMFFVVAAPILAVIAIIAAIILYFKDEEL